MVGAVFGFAAKNIPEASVIALNPPSIPGLGNTGGFQMYIINKAGDSPEVMAECAQAFIAEARTNPAIQTIYTTFDTATPSLQFQINREKAAKDGVALPDIFKGKHLVTVDEMECYARQNVVDEVFLHLRSLHLVDMLVNAIERAVL